MRNPLRTEAEAFRFLIVVIVGAAIVVACAYANEWLGVAAAVLVVGGIVWWLWHAPGVPTAPEPAAAPAPTPPGTYRILLVAPPGAAAGEVAAGLRARADGRATEVLVVVPALATPVEALTGAVDDRRDEAQRTADALAARLADAGLAARGIAGADEPLLAVDDALREFGADEVVIAGDEELLAAARGRIAAPVSLLP